MQSNFFNHNQRKEKGLFDRIKAETGHTGQISGLPGFINGQKKGERKLMELIETDCCANCKLRFSYTDYELGDFMECVITDNRISEEVYEKKQTPVWCPLLKKAYLFKHKEQ